MYGFLKNQRYFEPFLFLAFRDKGLSFTLIGALIGFREICINLMEIPTGAVADVLGRRRAMIASFVFYIAAFAIFGVVEHLALLFVAMFFFSVGEAFRTGTHKAIIFDWLAGQGRAEEKTRVYGHTRSWSQLGSALSALIAAGLVFTVSDYSAVFLFSIAPYAANIVNFLTYPAELDGPRRAGLGLGAFRNVCHALRSSLRQVFRHARLRRLLAESMTYEGIHKASKDYLQPVLRSAALGLPFLLALDAERRTAVLVGVVYSVLYLLSSFASRASGALAERARGEERAARLLWAADLVVFAAMGLAVAASLWPLVIACFVALAVLQNVWRPMLISRFASGSARESMATALSIESQAKSLFVAAAAPLLGWAVDAVSVQRLDLRMLPIAAAGVLVSALMLLSGRARKPATGERPVA